MKKGLDRAFLEYGIRQPDLQVKDSNADILGIGKKWKKIKVNHLI